MDLQLQVSFLLRVEALKRCRNWVTSNCPSSSITRPTSRILLPFCYFPILVEYCRFCYLLGFHLIILVLYFACFSLLSLQPVRDTREKQVQLWKEFILDYCRTQKIFVIELEEEFPLFSNHLIESRSCILFKF